MFGRQDDDQQPATPVDSNATMNGTDSGATPVTNTWQHPGLPVDSTATPSDASQSPSLPTPVDNSQPSASTASTDSLIAIKQQALGQLSPLVGQLDQTPEEKFRTTMMMIQASDNQSLIQSAYDAAQAITDEKERAQALLDIINEINYFTQQKDS